jgi:hypothetical protein
LGLQQDLAQPARASLPADALLYVAAPRGEEIQAPRSQRLLVDRPPTAQHDPVAGVARPVVLPLSNMTRFSAPFTVFSIPDPFERTEQVRLSHPPLDNDPPSTSAISPPRSELTLEPPAMP